ncbi:MAG: polyribonucleotide nucleotidyltransferase [Planctomycetia bacterium]|nr:polyribonucleotide nucleotidyltransferase [Planctomycetia bacterium]
MSKKIRVEKKIGNQILYFETGELAKQAGGSVLIGYGDTVVLVAATAGNANPGQDFFPLTCDYRERVAAAGKFPGGFLKREGRPTLKETLTSRLIDRPIRPLFPKWFKNEVQVICTVLASDRQHDGDMLAMNGASAALSISPVPFGGPISSVRLACVEQQLIPFPTQDELDESDLDLVISGNDDSILMIEGFAREMPEELMEQAIAEAHVCIREINALQKEFIEKVQPAKMDYACPEDDGLYEKVSEKYYDEFYAAKHTEGKLARAEAVEALKAKIVADFIPEENAENGICPKRLEEVLHDLESRVVRDQILAGNRPDGRGLKEIRKIECKVGVLPRVHGSAVFQRGETQALITVTLGTTRDEQRVDGLFDEYSKKFMLDYYFPPFSVGECRRLGSPGRREIGHGALAERSVKPVLPEVEDFPYTIRIISDILESNGSSSMASVCGATLGLMDAGVPISNPVAGISVGLVKEPEKWVIMTDIIGDEDHFGDMDFKVAGTQHGITGIQLDLKVDGISPEIIHATLKQSREARIEILRNMLRTIQRPRSEISPWAPRLLRTKINPEKIGLLIGPGGKTVRAIQDTTGATIDIEEDGTVLVSSLNMDAAQEALRQVDALTATVELGKIYDGRVTSIKDFGAFIEILPGRDGLCHISELSDGYVPKVSEICAVGDPMKVKVIDIDEQDRVKLSRRAAMIELGLSDVPEEDGGDEMDDSRR